MAATLAARRAANGRTGRGAVSGKFQHAIRYRSLLGAVFASSRPLLKEGATIYVRTDSRVETLLATSEVLAGVFPEWAMEVRARPLHSDSQTRLFGRDSRMEGEVDLILTPR